MAISEMIKWLKCCLEENKKLLNVFTEKRDIEKTKNIINSLEASTECIENTLTKQEAIKYTEENIKFFETLYGGKFEDTLKIKENKTAREDSDASEWEYDINQLNKYKQIYFI